MKQKLNTNYSELREFSERMLRLVQDTLVGSTPIHLKTSFNNDLTILSEDWDDFLIKYNREFGVELHGLIYTDYFEEENPLLGFILLPFRVVWWILIYLPARLFGISKDRIIWYKQYPPLTIGDLVLSAMIGRFVKREWIEINIKR